MWSKDDELLPLDESSVDALVADTDPADESHLSFLDGSVRTPSVPPGLGFGHSHPPMQFGESMSIIGPPSQSGVIAAPIKSPAPPRPVTPLVPKTTMKPIGSGVKDETLAIGSEAKKSIKELAAKSGLSQDIAAQASSKTPKGKGVLQEEDFPALDSVKTASPPKVTPALPSKPSQSTKTPVSRKTAGDTTGKALLGKTVHKPDKRPVPGTLDIAAATKTVAQGASTLPTPTPTSVSSPMAKAGPKTLRLVQTPRAETPPIHIPPAAAASIRAAGIGSAGHRPATPASENVSDTASIISASISASRSSSPPPIKVGSASVRQTTKSQQRKQRKEASKEAAAQIAETKPVEPEVEIAPILGRKKKQKKERKTTSASIAPSRPETPSAADSQADMPEPQKANIKSPSDEINKTGKRAKDATPIAESPRVREAKSRDVKSPPRSPTAVDTSIKLNESTKTTVLTPDYVSHTTETKQEQPVDEDIGDIPNLRDVLRAIVEGGELSDPEAISFFRSIQGYRSDSPVRKTVNEHPVLLTPNGDCLLNLTEDEANLFLELQDLLRADSVRPTAFSAPRYAPATGFSLVKNRAVPNGTPSYFPSGPDNYPSDPVGKMHREEAISCINQHVLPSLNLSSYKSMGSGSSSSSSPNPNFGKNVNLQQLAPWIYPSSSTDGNSAEDQRKMFSGRAGDDFPSVGTADAAAYPGYDSPDGSGPSPAIGSTPLMSVEDAEAAWGQSKKQHEALDKKFRQLQTKNRRLVGLH
ncbi:hypothetical protein F5B20DRAFT_466985 [Whalleya microplaca]|nr:hypothetical protein F5B20DRAFT_466985 [Whalleya microplaca]